MTVMFGDSGFPTNVPDDELKNRLRLAVQNRRQLDLWIDAVTKELMRRAAR